MRMIELFSGIGGLGYGFIDAGFIPILAIEKNMDAVRTYNRNLPSVAIEADVRNVIAGITADLIVAGTPCQGFSTLGKRNPLDDRNDLSLYIYKWAIKSSAKVVVIENVIQFCNSPQWYKLRQQFCNSGYSCVVWKLNSADYNTPQIRKRGFTIFSKLGTPILPQPNLQHLSVKDAFIGLPSKANSINYHVSPVPTDLAMSRIKLIPKCGDKRDIMKKASHLCPDSWKRMGNQAVDVWGRMDWNKPSNTIRCCFQSPSKGRYLHPSANRAITLREGARLQGIPDNWSFNGSNTSIAKQIGNGVPIPLSKAVAKSIEKLYC